MLSLSFVFVGFAVKIVVVALFFTVVRKFFLIDALLLLFGCRRAASKRMVATALKGFDVSVSVVGVCRGLVSGAVGSRALVAFITSLCGVVR